jgi:hypothetical protein
MPCEVIAFLCFSRETTMLLNTLTAIYAASVLWGSFSSQSPELALGTPNGDTARLVGSNAFTMSSASMGPARLHYEATGLGSNLQVLYLNEQRQAIFSTSTSTELGQPGQALTVTVPFTGSSPWRHLEIQVLDHPLPLDAIEVVNPQRVFLPMMSRG